MIHMTPLAQPHGHATVAEARECEAELQYEASLAQSEIHAENAWLRAAEYDPVAQYETLRELAMEEAILDLRFGSALIPA